ncbi:hypothetical protein ACFQFH_00625 [Halobaculum halobium]|uniref:Uncharacterized protein n=1 Tax=Halobaculum halobium TaxID=3032281 RepID=A0ABD5TAD3_9EURY
MTSVNLTPITKEEQPTSHVTVGKSKVGSRAEIARVRHAGREAFFRVDTEEDGFASTIKNKVYLNSNVATLFGGSTEPTTSTWTPTCRSGASEPASARPSTPRE